MSKNIELNTLKEMVNTILKGKNGNSNNRYSREGQIALYEQASLAANEVPSFRLLTADEMDCPDDLPGLDCVTLTHDGFPSVIDSSRRVYL